MQRLRTVVEWEKRKAIVLSLSCKNLCAGLSARYINPSIRDVNTTKCHFRFSRWTLKHRLSCWGINKSPVILEDSHLLVVITSSLKIRSDALFTAVLTFVYVDTLAHA